MPRKKIVFDKKHGKKAGIAKEIFDSDTKELQDSRMALMNILEDVEDARKTAEDEKNKTLAIVASLSDGLLVLNKEGRIFLSNPQAEKYLGLSAGEVIGKTVLELSEKSKFDKLTNLLSEELEEVFRKELDLDKSLILEISVKSIGVGGGELGKIIILHDITREKTIERMKTEFVSLAAHQLRTPLSAIKWTVRMILDEDVGQITLSQRELLEKTYKSNERMIWLINDLLNVTKIEEGRYLYRPVFSDIGNIIRFVINSQEDYLKRKNIRIEFDRPKEKMPMVAMDVEKMRLVLQNLIGNAIEYTPPGGEIKVILKNNKKDVELQIKDNGVGIPKDQQKRVFSKFFRGSNVVKMDTDGSGLGIFIAKNIIDAHKGKIWFSSEEGEGTTFCFTLPVKKEFEEFPKEF
ncbi:MAG: ATP-binding protein [Candidatus Nealsonbacteria bacterium]